MKKWQQRFMAIAIAMGYKEKIQAGTLTADDQKLIFAEYEKTHNITFDADRLANEDVVVEQNVLSAEEIATISTLIGVEPAQAPATPRQAVNQMATTIQSQQQTIENQQQQIETLAAAPETPAVQTVRAAGGAGDARTHAIVLGHAAHTATHLFGIESPLYARSNWWNNITATRQATGDNLQPEQRNSFMSAFTGFASGLSARARELAASNQISLLNYQQMIAGNPGIDYSGLQAEVEGLGGEYVVRRTDMILAYFRSLPSVASIFPVVSNVQNKELAPTATFGELSQGYREGRVFKGGVEFGAEIYSVVDVMFKYQFVDLIALEKKYIGYLNREGSDVIKWSFIEWIMVYFGKQLINEQNRRRVIGVAVPQQNVVSNSAMLGADGALRAIERVEEQLKVLPFDDLKLYSDSNMLDYVTDMWNKVVMILDTTDGMKIYANLKHKPWYVALYAEKYNAATGAIVSGQQLPDLHPDNIVWVPNMPNNMYKMWITIPGNVETYEDKPMEMLTFYFLSDFENVLTRSRWKEGAGVLQPGAKFSSKADLVASERKMQWIFTNFPASTLTLDTTVSVAANNLFIISGAPAGGVTTVNGYKIETVYKFVAGSDFATTLLKKLGAFSKISADFDPGAEGDYIKVYAELEDYTTTIEGKTVTLTRATGKLLELERKVTA